MIVAVIGVALLVIIVAYVPSGGSDESDVPTVRTHPAPHVHNATDGATKRAMQAALATLDRPEPLGVDGDGSFGQPIVGESYYLGTFEDMFGPRKEHGVERSMVAVVACESDNKYDPLAVRVELDSGLVGQLSREDARLFRTKYGGRDVMCKAQIRGRMG